MEDFDDESEGEGEGEGEGEVIGHRTQGQRYNPPGSLGIN